MSQTGYTPIQLYRTTTSGAAPVSGNLNPGELAININDADMALYAKNNTGTVKRLINNPAGLKYPTVDGTANQAVVTDGAGNLTLGTPALATTATTATAANGIKSATTTVVLNSATAPTSGQVLTATSSTAATWQTPTSSGGTVTSVAATVPAFLSVSGSPITSSGTLAISLSGTALPVANGGTGTTTPSLVAGTNVTIGGTWPNQTVNASGGGGGSVISVSGTAPVVSSGGTTPVISMAAATTSVNGYLTNTDWNTFNGKYSTGGALGTPSSGTLTNCTADGTNAVGYKNIPQTGSDKTTAYTLVTGDVGKYVGVGTSGSIVVPTSTFANGDAISVYNNTTGNITITTSAPTAYIAGTNTVKTSITLATRGIATILFVSSTVCVVTGNVS